jgi:hypothetical protein
MHQLLYWSTLPWWLRTVHHPLTHILAGSLPQVPNALRSNCRICGEGMLKSPRDTTGVCVPHKCFRAAVHANCSQDVSVCGAGTCIKSSGLCAGEQAAPDGARCAQGHAWCLRCWAVQAGPC